MGHENNYCKYYCSSDENQNAAVSTILGIEKDSREKYRRLSDITIPVYIGKI